MKLLGKTSVVLLLSVMLSIPAMATNGDNLIGVGPISRAMGGVGIAAPQDAISAVFSNPAAMCVGPFCPTSEVDFSGTMFMPDVKTKISGPGVGGTNKASSDDEVYAIPAFGLSVPIGSAINPPLWRFGLAAYGVSGLGVDYRGSDIDSNPPGFGGSYPMAAGIYTQVQSMRFAPAVAYQPNAKFSFGLAGIVEYSNLDLAEGSDWTYGFGIQAGTIFKATNNLSLGLNIITPRKLEFKNVADFDFNGSLDDLDLEAPLEIGGGAAYTISKLLVEADVKWLNWGDADGYKDFDWEDQWVFAIGAQYEAIPKLFIRAGYNYGKTPVKDNDGFVGNSNTTVQGKTLPTYYYETFRLVGFPALAEHHITFGLGYEFTPNFSVNLGYMHAFKESLSEKGTDVTGMNPVEIESELTEDAIDFGLTWRF